MSIYTFTGSAITLPALRNLFDGIVAQRLVVHRDCQPALQPMVDGVAGGDVHRVVWPRRPDQVRRHRWDEQRRAYMHLPTPYCHVRRAPTAVDAGTHTSVALPHDKHAQD